MAAAYPAQNLGQGQAPDDVPDLHGPLQRGQLEQHPGEHPLWSLGV